MADLATAVTEFSSSFPVLLPSPGPYKLCNLRKLVSLPKIQFLHLKCGKHCQPSRVLCRMYYYMPGRALCILQIQIQESS